MHSTTLHVSEHNSASASHTALSLYDEQRWYPWWLFQAFRSFADGTITADGELLNRAPHRSYGTINNQDCQCLATDFQVRMKPLTAPRTVYLQDGDTFPFQDLVFADDSGTYFDVLRITILPGSSMSNVIGTSDGTFVLSRPLLVR